MRSIFTLQNINEPKIKRKEYLAPSFIFIPITDKLSRAIRLGDKLLKGEYLTSKDYSSVSGIIKGKKTCAFLDKRIQTIVVENNFKEQRIRKKKSDFINNINRLVAKSVIEKLNQKKENLVLACFSEVINAFNIKYYISDNYHDLLDALDVIKTAFGFKKIYIVVKDFERHSIEKFIKIIGNYPEIKFVTIPNVYPVINTNYFENKLGINNSCILSFQEFYPIFHIINYGCHNNEVYITLNIGNKECIVVKTKVGTSVQELLTNLKINYNDFYIYINGCIGGYKINKIDDLIISKELESIFFTKEELPKPLKCVNCGVCYKFCPVNIDPRKKISKTDKCIKCGLCSYICPSYIDLFSQNRGD